MFQTLESRQMFASLGMTTPVLHQPQTGPSPVQTAVTLPAVREEVTISVPRPISSVSNPQPQIKAAYSEVAVCPLP